VESHDRLYVEWHRAWPCYRHCLHDGHREFVLLLPRRRPSEFNWLQHALLPALAALVLCLPLRGVVASTLPSGGGKAPMTYIPYLGIDWVVLGKYTGYLTRFRSELLLGMGKVFE
jgi:hypothetical protein